MRYNEGDKGIKLGFCSTVTAHIYIIIKNAEYVITASRATAKCIANAFWMKCIH